MRVTRAQIVIEVEPELQRQFKARVALEGRTIKAVLTDAIRRYLATKARPKR